VLEEEVCKDQVRQVRRGSQDLSQGQDQCEIRAHSCGHNRGTAAVAIGEEVGPIDQAFIGYPKRSKEKAVKVNRLESPSREGRSASESRARPM
jgi:hypothetical protein